MGKQLVLLFVFLYCSHICKGQLTVNVRNNGGEVIKEKIGVNTTLDTVILELEMSDGTHVTQFIDFENEIQIFKSIVLGEEERGQSQYQVMCYVIRFVKNEFISSDAMSKLRQKNPSAIRHPEEDKGQEPYPMDLSLDVTHSYYISRHIPRLCENAKESTYARDSDIKYLAKSLNKDLNVMQGASKRMSTLHVPRCKDVVETWRSCTCEYEICIGWYPCGLKYCKGKDSSGKTVSYRCGIKTCRKCRLFSYLVRQKQMCIWDE